jgi:predicted nucleotidyltransferase
MPRETATGTLADFRAAIIRDGMDAAASTHLLDRVPFVFNDNWELYRAWRRKLSRLIEVDPLNIKIIGSAGIGFSLNPNKDFKAFSHESDIDVAVISEHHFAISWRALRTLKLPDARNYKDREAIKEHRTNHIYWGTIATDRVLHYLPFVRPWTEALAAMAGESPTEEREIKIRLYRDYEALRSYHMSGLETLAATLMAS